MAAVDWLIIFCYYLFGFWWAAPGLGSYVEALVRKHDTQFNVCFLIFGIG